MIEEYNIYTDASFENNSKLATYSVVVIQKEKEISGFGKKCEIPLNNSAECEIFAVFQALNLIEKTLLKVDKKQIFNIKTDCEAVKHFFNKEKCNILKNNIKLKNTIKHRYSEICYKIKKANSDIQIQCIPRTLNNIAHKYSYKTFRDIKKQNNLIIINREIFIEILANYNKKQNEVIIFLLNLSKNESLILRTQKEISKVLNIPITTINKYLKKLIKLELLIKIKNGTYMLTI